MTDILVTGGCGFIGSNFIRYLLGKWAGVRIVNLDRLTYAGKLENLSDVESVYGGPGISSSRETSATGHWSILFSAVRSRALATINRDQQPA